MKSSLVVEEKEPNESESEAKNSGSQQIVKKVRIRRLADWQYKFKVAQSIIIGMKKRLNSNRSESSCSKDEDFVPYKPQRQFKPMRISKISLPEESKEIGTKTKGIEPKNTGKASKKENAPSGDLFESLGDQVVKNVQISLEVYRDLVAPKTGNNSNPLDSLSENFKQILVKYLIYGFYEMFLDQKMEQFTKKSLSKEDIGIIEGLVTQIQECIYSFHGHTPKEYQKRCKLIASNVKDFSNKELRQKILERRIYASQLAVFTQNQLDPEERREANLKKMKYLIAERVIDYKDSSEEPELSPYLEEESKGEERKPVERLLKSRQPQVKKNDPSEKSKNKSTSKRSKRRAEEEDLS